MNDDVLTMPAGHELNLLVHAALGGRIFSESEMREEAMTVWKEQPNVQSFLLGFDAEPANDEARERGFSAARPSDVAFKQRIPAYSTDGGEAVTLAERFGLILNCEGVAVLKDGDDRRVTAWKGQDYYASGVTTPHAVARWVAAYVVNGEVKP